MAMAPDVARNMVVAAIFAIFAPVFAIFAVRGAHIMNFGARALGVMVDDRTRQLSLFMVDLRAVTAQFLSVTRQFTAPMRAGDAGGERGQADRSGKGQFCPNLGHDILLWLSAAGTSWEGRGRAVRQAEGYKEQAEPRENQRFICQQTMWCACRRRALFVA